MMESGNKRVALICYSYSDGMAYMEQKMAEAFQMLGYEVKVICTTANRVSADNVENTQPRTYRAEKGYTVCRLPFAGKKIPRTGMPIVLLGMYKELCQYDPQLIYHMGVSAVNLLDVRRFMKTHPNTKLYLDNHAGYHNSANNGLSKYLLHGFLYKTITKLADPYIRKYFYVGPLEHDFLLEPYGIPEEKTEFFSLGDFCDPDEQYEQQRASLRQTFGFSTDDVVIAHSGKFTGLKQTLEIIEMVTALQKKKPTIKLLLIGGVQDPKIAERFEKLVKENEGVVQYVGWKSGAELRQYLIAADLYLQFSPSSTLQTALCCRCAVITGDPDKAYIYYPENLAKRVETIEQMGQEIQNILETGNMQEQVQESYRLAQQLLDYRCQIKNKICVDENQGAG